MADYTEDEMITLIRTMELLGDEGKHRWRYPAGMNKENKKNNET